MEQFDITKLPFTSISRENWQMLKDLDMETLYDVIQHVSTYVLTGEECDCDTTLSKVVCNQLISVINRKGQKSYNSSKNLPNGKKEKAKEEEAPAQVSVYTPKDETMSKPYQPDTEGVPPMEAWMDEMSGLTVEPVRALRMNKLCHKYGYPYEEMLSMYQQYERNKAVRYG